MARITPIVKEAIENEYLITLMINDWTKVYTKRRPTDQRTSVADNFCTIISRLLKTSRPFHGRRLKPFTTTRELMWKVYLFFFFHSPLLKTFLSHMQHYETALDQVLQSHLKEYLSKFVVLLPGNWPSQFFCPSNYIQGLQFRCGECTPKSCQFVSTQYGSIACRSKCR